MSIPAIVLTIETALAAKEADIVAAATALRAGIVARKPLVDALVAARAQCEEHRPAIRAVQEIVSDESKAWVASLGALSNPTYDVSSLELRIFAPTESLR